MKKLSLVLPFVFLCVVLGGFSAVWAQDDGSGTFTLDEITVTAEKGGEQNLQKVAMSVEVVQGDIIRNTGRTTMEDILKDIPNVSTSDAGGSKTINIRGIGMDLPSGEGTGEASVSTNFDGASQGRIEGQMFGYFDIERVEVLRGPQGTLYGRNSTAGAVNIISTKPTTDEVKGYTSLEFGTYSKMKAEAAINIPISNTVAARLATVFSEEEATTKDDHGFRQSMQGFASRLQVRYMPSDETSVNLLTSYYKTHGSSYAGFVYQVDWDAGRYDLNNNTYPYDQLGKSETESLKLSLNVETPVGPGILTFLPTLEKLKNRTVNYGPMPGPPPPPGVERENIFSLGGRPFDNESRTVELRYSSKEDSTVKWVGGLYYSETDEYQAPLEGDYLAGTRGNGLPGPQPLYTYETSAAFGQATVPLTDSFRVVLGARTSVDKKAYDDFRYTGLPDKPDYKQTDSFKFDYFDWKAGLENDFGENVMAYLTVATGHKPGGFNTDTSSKFDPESSLSYELGVKSRMLDNRLQVNGDVYFISYEDYQTVDAYNRTPGSFPPDMVVIFYNAASSEIYGAELDVSYLIGSGTVLRASGAYLKTEYTSDFFIHENPETLVNLKGGVMPHSPEFSFKLSAEHDFVLPDGSSLKPNLSYRWTDGQYVGVFSSPETWSPSYDVLDVSIAYTSTKSWSLNLYCNNALDKHFYTGIQGAGGDTVAYVAGAPLTAGLILNVNF